MTERLLLIFCAMTYVGIGVFSYVKRGVEPNLTVGYRNKYTLGDLDVWREVNPRAGRALPIYGLSAAAAFLLALIYPTPQILIGVLTGSVVPIIWIVVHFNRVSRRLHLDRHPEGPPKFGSPAVAGGRGNPRTSVGGSRRGPLGMRTRSVPASASQSTHCCRFAGGLARLFWMPMLSNDQQILACPKQAKKNPSA